MKVILICGCTIDDAVKNTFHENDNKRSKGDIERKKHHYLLHAPPEMYCISCDRYRPCTCDVVAQA